MTLRLYFNGRASDITNSTTENWGNMSLVSIGGHRSPKRTILYAAKGDATWKNINLFTLPGLLVKDSWANGAITVNVSAGAGFFGDHVDLRCSLHRVNHLGTVQESTDYSPIVIAGDQNTLNVPSYSWDHNVIQDSDRLMLKLEARNNGATDDRMDIYVGVFSGGDFSNWCDTPFNLNHIEEINTEKFLYPDGDTPTLPTLVPTGVSEEELIEAEGSITDEGAFDLGNIKGYFRYREGTLHTSGVKVNYDDYHIPSPVSVFFPTNYSDFHRSRILSVKIDSNERGTIYDVSDSAFAPIKDKTNSIVTVYPEEELTVFVEYATTSAMSANAGWGTSIESKIPTSQYINSNRKGVKTVSTSPEILEMPLWTVPNQVIPGNHLAWFYTDSMGPLDAVWFITFHIGDIPYYNGKPLFDEHLETTPYTPEQTNVFSDTLETGISAGNSYIIQAVIDIYDNSEHEYTHFSNYVQVDVLVYHTITVVIKDEHDNLLGSINLIDKFTEDDWEQGVFNNTKIEQGKLKLR